MAQGGVQYGGHAFKVKLHTRECSCKSPRLYHFPYSHLITTANLRSVGLSHLETVRLNEFSLQIVAVTWEERFEPYLD